MNTVRGTTGHGCESACAKSRSQHGAAVSWLLPGTLVLAACGFFFFVLPNEIAARLNGVVESPPYAINPDLRRRFRSYDVVDLHADTLLWNRDPSVRGSYGHIDLPRLRESDMALQVFSAVTKTPRRLNFEHNRADSDNITALVVAQRWPVATWSSLTQRALYQAARLQRLADASDGRFVIVRRRAEIAALLAARRRGEDILAGLLAIEGLHAIEASRDNLVRLFDAGYRMMGLTHFFDNAIGGSAHGAAKGGLTPFGVSILQEMENRGIVVDLAHASPALIDDVLDRAGNPVVVSHTGVKGTCDRTRNLSDAQLHRVAANGGLVGIAFFDEAVCGTGVSAIVSAIRYVSELVGVEHVAFGSDFDGAVTTPFDVTGLPLLVEALEKDGFSPDDIGAIAGGNVLRLLGRILPDD